MKKVLLFSIILMFVLSCEKQKETNFCGTQQCDNYLRIWKELFMTRNNMSQDYFQEHIFPYETEIDKWNDGQSFRVNYKVTIGWAEAKLNDQLQIWLDPSTAGLFPSIYLPRSAYLSKDQINKMLDIFAFSSTMYKVNEIQGLKYSSRDEALTELKSITGISNLGDGEIFYEGPSFHVSTGHPYLRVGATIDASKNQCLSGTIDLVTGETEVWNKPCIIVWCFTGGTTITLADNKVVPIEKIKVPDKVLSMNIETGKVEEDVVLKVDSVFHDNIIKISFNDKTGIESTDDHPYYVKGKGWSSFNPSETDRKYGIHARQLNPGDTCIKLKNNELSDIIINSIRPNPGNVMTYNLKLKKNKNYFAMGVLVSSEEK